MLPEVKKMSIQFSRTLQPGSSGEDVKKLQDALSQLGYDPGPIDGVYGLRTKSAVMTFQRDKGLVQDGVVGPQTAAAITRNLVLPAYLKLGSRGPEVEVLQGFLQHSGYYHGPIDGIFGPQTREAVISFQRDHGLLPDGIAGPKTWDVIYQIVKSRGTTIGPNPHIRPNRLF